MAAAAWAGAPLAACHVGTSGQPGHFSYQVSYFSLGWQQATAQQPASGFYSVACVGCPFQAVEQALFTAYRAGALGVFEYEQGRQVVAQAETIFAGVRAPAQLAPAAPALIQCAACKCDSTTDPFGVGCDCVWLAMHQSVGAHA
ncbi:hypothetical protein QMK33_19465 [Hymenobacter sp. H14-R3]|uniref:hypothetical protein n=1 Tax=Hymenobacter sp. H14-R3 TaxID=3046308 RepID=UPI0024BB5748|nr:hypothetical protein [Hymenobacter sp. H14-R3]MDJ0367333.1 hypothetical protein [Hymenobacter sp. H14-R3]